MSGGCLATVDQNDATRQSTNDRSDGVSSQVPTLNLSTSQLNLSRFVTKSL